MSIFLKDHKITNNFSQSINHYNYVLNSSEPLYNPHGVWEPLVYSFELLMQEFCIIKGYESRPAGIAPKLLAEGLTFDSHQKILQSDFVKKIVVLEQLVMDHQTLIQGNYRPGEEIDKALYKKSIYHHKKLNNAYNRYISDDQNQELSDAAIRKLGKLIYTVRSNVAHGAKTPYGPDEEQVKRDNEVLKICTPILKVIIEELYGAPSEKFFVYGTLMPGKENFDIIKKIDGEWINLELSGSITEKSGLKYFSWNPNSNDKVEGKILISKKLPHYWKDIDRFEGSRYKRQIGYCQDGNNVVVFSFYTENSNYSK